MELVAQALRVFVLHAPAKSMLVRETGEPSLFFTGPRRREVAMNMARQIGAEDAPVDQMDIA